MAKSTKFKKGEYAIQINEPGFCSLVKILGTDATDPGCFLHEHLGTADSVGNKTGSVHQKWLRKATKKEILIHAVRKEY